MLRYFYSTKNVIFCLTFDISNVTLRFINKTFDQKDTFLILFFLMKSNINMLHNKFDLIKKNWHKKNEKKFFLCQVSFLSK